jgi:hypothetical protein
VAWSQPALTLFAKVQAKVERLGVDVALPSDERTRALVTLMKRSTDEGFDLEAALRQYVLAMAERIREIESVSKND